MTIKETKENSEDMNLEIGLTTEEVEKRLARYGYNEVPEKKERFLKRLGKKFWGLVPWMLEATALVTLVLGKYVDALVIVVLLLFNAGMSLWREGKAKAAMAALKQKLRIQSRIKREGKWIIIPARALVPGDVVRIRIGDFLPADIKIIEGSLGLDQSQLTGESIVVDKATGEIAYSGSAVTRGEATGVVHATGIKTYFGKTISLLQMTKPKLHMEEITGKVARQLALIVLACILLVFIFALITGFPLSVILPLAGVLLVASVPVAMPTMFTVNMALGSSVLAKQGVLVTRLSASEDAATMDVLCVDKTGTITMNKLFVEEMVSVNGFEQSDIVLYGFLASKEANQDPIDIAFLTAAKEKQLSINTFVQTEFIPFDPKTRLTESIIQKNGETFFVGKGSFDTICAACNTSGKGAEALSKQVEALSAKGLRVIAVAKGENRSNLQIVGLAGIADRLRPDSRESLNKIKELGISVKMLTGDALPIAKNIAYQVGLGDNVITMAKVQEAEARTNSRDMELENSDGIAQIYPEDKFSIVKDLQRLGHVVGMTGDGVNDAPALGQAEVGIAVKNASDIAKDSASAVLTADGIDGIIAMVKTSRTIYQRIYSWTLMMVARKSNIIGYIVLMLLISRSFMLSITGTVIMLFLGDFGSMALSSDNVRSSLKPDSFKVSRLFGVSGWLGILMIAEGTIFTVIALSIFNLTGNVDKIYTFGFAYLNMAGILTIPIVRERGHFWESKPSRFLTITVLAELLIVIIISLTGVLELAPLGWVTTFTIFGYTLLVTFLVNDSLKVFLVRKFRTDR
jgi:H+-transporting ATPase